MRILKFGGSSVATAERVQNVVEILESYHKRGISFGVVFSAFGGVTDTLLKMSRLAEKGDESYLELLETFKARHTTVVNTLLEGTERTETLVEVEEGFTKLTNLLQGIYLVQEASLRTTDLVSSFGERNSAFIIAAALRQVGLNAAYLDARKVVKTDKKFGSAVVKFKVTNQNIQDKFASTEAIQVITGFIGSTEGGGLTTTLGRGGSDYTAAIVAAALNAEVIEIWTDVNGVMTADPRKVKNAFSLPSMTYSEAMEMSHFGAKVIYPPTLQPALDKQIPLRIKNTFQPDFEGTLVSDLHEPTESPIRGISTIGNVSLLTLQGSGLVGVPGIAARLFNALARNSVNVILITQGSSEHSISFAVKPEMADLARRQIEIAFQYEINSNTIQPLKVESDLCVIAAIGENMRYRSGMSGQMFQALGKNGINIIAIAQGSSERNISAVIRKSDEIKALNALHERFFDEDVKVLHLFIVGVGLIGGTLLNQIQKQSTYLKKHRSLEIRVVALANSKKMVFDENGVDLTNWSDIIEESEVEMEMQVFVDQMKGLNLHNSIFLDNTAHSVIADQYAQILDASISISTPNKIATSSSYEQYKKLKGIAKKRGVQLMYETNVGAGLPVLTTLKDLISSGDQILKIEGVLSGSLSFIFNTFKKGIKFSDVVKDAQQLGYTEPDPRTDLSGLDVRRKLLILARESGIGLDAKDVTVENILTKDCNEATTVPAFFEALEAANDVFEARSSKAAAEGKVLRFIATLDGTEANIALKAVDATHPFYSLSGSDNMIVFTTERYKARPLVIRGPGAGAEVTAAGVFAEIISIGNYLS